jgi:hypothetical protein
VFSANIPIWSGDAIALLDELFLIQMPGDFDGFQVLVRKRKTDLTLTGLLMEGLGHQKSAISVQACPDGRFIESSAEET